MKFRILVILGALLVAGPAFAQKVYIDYDKDYKKPVHTFKWAETKETSLESTNSLMHSRIINAIQHYIHEVGVREVAENPDVYVTYHVSTANRQQLNTTSWGYGYPAGWAWNPYWGNAWGMGMGTSTTTVSTYTDGTLIIDVWDAESKMLIWRGTATATLKQKPEKQAKQLDKALQKMMHAWNKTKAKM